jgi:DNA-binding response OmpR family regulator
MNLNAKSPLTILIVEDQDDLRSLLIDIMERMGGFHTVGAADGLAGLEAVMQHLPDCVIVDVLMPQLDGFQFVQAMRGDPQTATIPLIVLTALAQESNQFRGMALGADKYLLKPARPAQLIAAVREVLAISETQRQARQELLAAQEPPEMHS